MNRHVQDFFLNKCLLSSQILVFLSQFQVQLNFLSCHSSLFAYTMTNRFLNSSFSFFLFQLRLISFSLAFFSFLSQPFCSCIFRCLMHLNLVLTGHDTREKLYWPKHCDRKKMVWNKPNKFPPILVDKRSTLVTRVFVRRHIVQNFWTLSITYVLII